jgi:hypothetical protein
VLYSKTSHAKIAAKYNKDGKINKEDVALITWARSQANSEKERK